MVKLTRTVTKCVLEMMPLWAIHKQIAAAIDPIVQHDQLTDGTRKIARITECAGVENDRVVLSRPVRVPAAEDRRGGTWRRRPDSNR